MDKLEFEYFDKIEIENFFINIKNLQFQGKTYIDHSIFTDGLEFLEEIVEIDEDYKIFEEFDFVISHPKTIELIFLAISIGGYPYKNQTHPLRRPDFDKIWEKLMNLGIIEPKK
jgi:hypothetical protein